MIKSVTLHNYRQYKHEEVKFASGLNVVVGPNFSGKSTLFEAVRFALFGTKALEDKATSWIRDGERNGSVTVKLDLDGREVSVFRDKDNATLTVDGVHLSSYKSEVSKQVEELLGVDLVALEVGYCVRQKELAWFSSLTPGKKRKEVERLSKLNRLDFAVARIKEDRTAAEIAMQTIGRELQPLPAVEEAEREAARLLSTKQSELVAVDDKVAELRTAVGAARDELEAARTSLKEVRGQEEQLEEKSKELERVVARSGSLRDALERYGRQVQRLGELGDTGVRLAGATIKVDAFEAHEKERLARDSVHRELRDVLARLESIDALNKGIEQAEAKVTELERQRVARAEQRTNAATEKRMLEQMVKRAASDGACPLGGTCDSASKSAELRAKDLHERLTQVSAQIARMDAEPIEDIGSWQRQHQDLVARRARAQLLSQRRAQLEQGLEPELESRADDLYDARQQLAEARRHHDEYLMMKDAPGLYDKALSERKEVIETEVALASQVAQLELAVQKLPATIGAVAVANTRLTELIVAEAQAEARAKALASAVAKAQADRELASREVERQRALLKEVQAASARVAELGAYLKHVQGFKAAVSAKLLPRIKGVANGIFGAVTANRYAELLVDQNFDVRLLTHDGHVRNVKSLAGSEEDLANLALRMALGTLMAGKTRRIDFAMLDEVSAHLDDVMIRRTVEGLLELTRVFKQIALVTHRGIEEEYASNVIRVSEGPNGSYVQ